MADIQFSQGFDGDKTYDVDDCRRTFLLTYSQADLVRFPTLRVFADCVIAAIRSCESKRQLLEWAVCLENHQEGAHHYHMSLKFDGPRRWKPIWAKIYNTFGISVDFALNVESGYVSAYRYVAKDKDFHSVLHSENHTKLENIRSPKTKKAMKRFSEKSRKRRSDALAQTFAAEEAETPVPPKKPKRLSNIDVADFLIRHGIRSDTVLLNESRKRAGEDSDLRAFILNKTPTQRRELVKTTWEIEDAGAKLSRAEICRMTVIKEAALQDCIPNCDGKWLRLAKDVLDKNDINVNSFARALRNAFTLGRQKGVNVMLVGKSDCAKSFLLKPIELIFKTFSNPATGKYAFVGLDEKEVLFLNDFRYSSEIIAWSEFLLLLEGDTVHLPRPKNMYATDIEIHRTNTMPIFATGATPITHRDSIEEDMMASRWTVINFHYKIPREKIVKMPSCPSCFCKLVLEGMERDS